MSLLIQQWSNNPFITLSGWVATIIALILAIVFFYIQKKRKIINYFYQTTLLVSDKLSEVEGLSIKYNDETVDKLSITSLEIINSGNVLIEDCDFYPQRKLKIVGSKNHNNKILFAKVAYQSYEDTIDCKITLDGENIQVYFQALEKNERVIINIYHTGGTETKFKVDGKIKDAGKITEGKPNKFIRKGLKKDYLFHLYIVPIIVAIIASVMGAITTGYISDYLYEKHEIIFTSDERRLLLPYLSLEEGDTVTIDAIIKTIVQLEDEVKEKEDEVEYLREIQAADKNRIIELEKEIKSKESEIEKLKQDLEELQNIEP